MGQFHDQDGRGSFDRHYPIRTNMDRRWSMCRITLLLALWSVTATAKDEIDRMNIIVTMKDDATNVLGSVMSEGFSTREEKLISVVNTLEYQAEVSQSVVFEYLNAEDTNGRRLQSHMRATTFWISNQMFIEGATEQMMAELRQIEGVESVELEEKFPLEEIKETTGSNDTITAANAVQWGINRVRADEVWLEEILGNNVVVANIDSGVRGSHRILSSSYVGSYGWYDPYDKTSFPNDQNGHGTHTMGTIVGSEGVGVAPGAKWMACKGCGTSVCTSSALLACGQFLLCPHQPSGPDSQRDCSKAPHIINNSWGGGQGNTWYRGVVSAWRAAGIIPVFSVGNLGPSCNSVNSPGDYANVISVGSTTKDSTISSFSSIGPTDGGLLKPEITAPGSKIRSAYFNGDDSFATMSGTSMAAPHVTGVIALMLSKNPELRYSSILNLIQDKAYRGIVPGLTQVCSDDEQDQLPNNRFGHGVIDALETINAVSHPINCLWTRGVGCVPLNECYFSWSLWTCVQHIQVDE